MAKVTAKRRHFGKRLTIVMDHFKMLEPSARTVHTLHVMADALKVSRDVVDREVALGLAVMTGGVAVKPHDTSRGAYTTPCVDAECIKTNGPHVHFAKAL